MSLTDKQKHRVVYYLGWAGLTLVADSTHYNSVVNDRLGTVAKPLNTQIENLVKDLLDCLQKIDEQLKSAQCRLAASSVDNITMNEREISMLKGERRRYTRELSDHLDIPIDKSDSGSIKVLS